MRLSSSYFVLGDTSLLGNGRKTNPTNNNNNNNTSGKYIKD